ncbi:MAG: flavin reductase family protein [Lachnospiraceae bacterium]|nr:flavin reductase family protein [Lachnospiraceae bacterium]MBR5993566.1 flavin reductase family protein [Lachnospiraceae bacterium]
MGKVDFKPGNMLYPLPVVMVTVADDNGKSNIITLAWAGTINSDPAMVSISVRKERYSYPLLVKNKEFCINLTTRELAFATDYCGVKSGRDTDKWKDTGLTPIPCSAIKADMIEESPVNIECKVTKYEDLGSHTIFYGEVVAVHADDKYMDEKGKFTFEDSDPITYSHGKYYTLGENIGKFGYSVQKKKPDR